MRDNRCPSCENDLSDVITSTIIKTYRGAGPEVHTISCPHCVTELSISVDVTTRLSRAGGA